MYEFSENTRLSYIFYFTRWKIMRVILDTDKKTITLPWNYREKLEAYNNMVMEISGTQAKKRISSLL